MPKPPPPSPERVRELVAATGQPLRALAKMMGYSNHQSLRQCMEGKASLPPHKASWLDGYAAFRRRLAERAEKDEAAWHAKNPLSEAK